MPELSYHYCPVCGQAYPADQISTYAHTCKHCGFTLYENQNATASAIIIQDGRLLLVKRAFDPNKGKWDFPGGFVDPDEPPEKAVVREVQEELGVKSTVVRIFGAYGPNPYQFQNKTRFNCDLYYVVTLQEENIQPGDDAAEYRWFDLDQVPTGKDIAFSNQNQVIADIKSDPSLLRL